MRQRCCPSWVPSCSRSKWLSRDAKKGELGGSHSCFTSIWVELEPHLIRPHACRCSFMLRSLNAAQFLAQSLLPLTNLTEFMHRWHARTRRLPHPLHQHTSRKLCAHLLPTIRRHNCRSRAFTILAETVESSRTALVKAPVPPDPVYPPAARIELFLKPPLPEPHEQNTAHFLGMLADQVSSHVHATRPATWRMHQARFPTELRCACL